MDTAPWPQEIAVMKPMEEMITNTASAPTENTNKTHQKPQPSTSIERKVRPQKDHALNCPRCNSTNTKFCYYNNYSLTQPRYFCKTCRRYWTAGGSLRNIPVGGGSRKNKRPNSSSFISSSTTSKMKIHELGNPNPKILGTQDLNLGFPSNFSQFIQFPNMETNPNAHITQTTNTSTTSQLSALELLNGIASSRGFMTPYMPMQIPDPNSVFPSGFNLEGNFKPTLNFSLDGLGGGGLQGLQENAGIGEGRILFPFNDLKSTTTTTTTTTTAAPDHHEHHQNHNGDHRITRDEQGDPSGYWNGMLGGPVPW